MSTLVDLFTLLIFPGGLMLGIAALAYEWVNRKLVARLQNRIGPRWFQPAADFVKLLAKEEVLPEQVVAGLFYMLPIIAVAGVFTAALSVPMFGAQPASSYPGDLVVTLYLLGLPTMCLGLAGSNTLGRFSLVGATRALTQFFSYEAPFMMAMLGPALVAQSWSSTEIVAHAGGRWLLLSQPIGFVVAMIGLLGKLEMPPFDAPEAETEIVAGALTEYSGRGLALFHLAKDAELVIGLALIAALYLGGGSTWWMFLLKTLVLLLFLAGIETLVTRLRIEQTVGLWWRYVSMLVLVQWVVTIVWEGLLL